MSEAKTSRTERDLPGGPGVATFLVYGAGRIFVDGYFYNRDVVDPAEAANLCAFRIRKAQERVGSTAVCDQGEIEALQEVHNVRLNAVPNDAGSYTITVDGVDPTLADRTENEVGSANLGWIPNTAESIVHGLFEGAIVGVGVAIVAAIHKHGRR